MIMNPAPDLPVELWLAILSYLPRSTLHKMIGVNRTLFELALNDLYQEVRFISDDKDMIKSFEQLKHEGIARRVRHLFIRPAFLPGMDDNDLKSKFERKFVSGMAYIKNIAKPSLLYNEKDNKSLLDPSDSYPILDLAKKALKSCTNVQKITIVLHDHTITSAFLSFLESLWSSNSIGPNIQKLDIDTTVVKLPIFLKQIDKYSTVLTHLEEFDLNLSISRFPHTDTHWYFLSQALTAFFTAFRLSLKSVSFSSMVIDDLGELFGVLPRLPKLRKFRFLAVINGRSFTEPDLFTEFISRHQSTLEALTVKPRPRHVTFNHSDDAYTIWLNHASGTFEKQYSFGALSLRRLHTLNIGLRDIDLYSASQDLSTLKSNTRTLLPNLSQVTPNLKKLVMTDVKLTFRRLSDILGTLSVQDGGSILEELSFVSFDLSPQHFDLLSTKLAKLKGLTIEYTNLSGGRTSMSCHNPHFYDTMEGRRYPAWGLLYLRLVRPNSCGHGHPNIPDMKAVAASFSQNVELDAGLTCHCLV